MRTRTVTAHQHDTLDALIWRHLGHTRDVVERVLELNPGLAGVGPILPHGHTVLIPQRVTTAAPAAPLIQLWT